MTTSSEEDAKISDILLKLKEEFDGTRILSSIQLTLLNLFSILLTQALPRRKRLLPLCSLSVGVIDFDSRL